MSYASRAGRARVSASNPRAFAVCQRCGIWQNREDLNNQRAWRGAALLQTWLFVCNRCLDVPQENGQRTIVYPPDPVPIPLPFPENFQAAQSVMGLSPATQTDARTGLPKPANAAVMQTTGLTLPPLQDVTLATEVDYDTGMITTAAGQMIMGPATPAGTPQNTGAITMSPSPTGRPPGYPGAIMPTELTEGLSEDYGVPLPVTSIIADGTPLVRVTCSGPHGLKLNTQVVVRGTENPLADGLFSVTPMTATVFSYGCYSPVPAGSILGPETQVVTAQIGLPRNFPAAPQTGLPQSHKTRTVQ